MYMKEEKNGISIKLTTHSMLELSSSTFITKNHSTEAVNRISTSIDTYINATHRTISFKFGIKFGEYYSTTFTNLSIYGINSWRGRYSCKNVYTWNISICEQVCVCVNNKNSASFFFLIYIVIDCSFDSVYFSIHLSNLYIVVSLASFPLRSHQLM